MSRDASPNSITYEYNSNHSSPYRRASPPHEHDILSQLKVQVFEKDQNRRNYNNLLAKFHKLQDELKKVSCIKEQNEVALGQLECDQRNKEIIDLKNKNENLFNDLNERIALNKKLYSENNNLFHELESKTAENQDLQDHICEQEDCLRRLSCEKEEIERKIYNLSQIKEKQEKQILDLTTQVNSLSNQNASLDNLLRSKNDQNMILINDLNEERNINKNLLIELRNKETNLVSCQQKLNLANDNIRGLQNGINNVNNMLKRNKEDIASVDNNLLKESAVLSQLISDNNHLNDLVEDRNAHIKNINNENDILKQNNTEANCENVKLNNLIQAYKKHMVLLISQNKKLAAEIQLLLGRDQELRNILERDGHLQDVRYENDQLINSSLESIKSSMGPGPMPQQVEERKSTTIKRTYSIDRNDNRNGNDNGEEKPIINSNINMSLSRSGINQEMGGSGMNQGMSSNINMSGSGINSGMGGNNNINQDNLKISQDNYEEQDQGEEMVNVDDNEMENENENEQEENI